MANRDEVIQKLSSICDLYSDILGMVILFGSYSRDEATGESDMDCYDARKTALMKEQADLIAAGEKKQ